MKLRFGSFNPEPAAMAAGAKANNRDQSEVGNAGTRRLRRWLRVKRKQETGCQSCE